MSKYYIIQEKNNQTDYNKHDIKEYLFLML